MVISATDCCAASFPAHGSSPLVRRISAFIGRDSSIVSLRADVMAARAKDATALERADASDPSTWTMKETSLSSLEQRCLAGLRSKGYPATSVQMDPAKLKGGYICDTMRVWIAYGQDAAHTHSAKAEGMARIQRQSKEDGAAPAEELPKSVIARPATAILKIASPLSNDHDVAMRSAAARRARRRILAPR